MGLVLASVVTAAAALRPWARLSVREGGRERRWTGTKGDGDVVPFRSHLEAIEKWGRGGWRLSVVTVLAMK